MMQARISEMNVGYTARGIRRYSIEVSHEGLHKHRVIQGDTKEIVRIKAAMQADEWEERYELLLARNNERKTKAEGQRYADECKVEAARRTAEAESERSRLASLITDTLKVDDKVDWNHLKDRKPFPESQPAPPTIPTEPQKSDLKYKPSIGLLDRLVSSRRARILHEKEALFLTDYEKWEANLERLREEHASAMSEWTDRKQEHDLKQAETNAIVDAKRAAYEMKQGDAILEYCDYVLSVSSYPDYFPQTFELDYDEPAKTLIVDYHLPDPEVLPKLKAVKYLSGRDYFEEAFISAR